MEMYVHCKKDTNKTIRSIEKKPMIEMSWISNNQFYEQLKHRIQFKINMGQSTLNIGLDWPKVMYAYHHHLHCTNRYVAQMVLDTDIISGMVLLL